MKRVIKIVAVTLLAIGLLSPAVYAGNSAREKQKKELRVKAGKAHQWRERRHEAAQANWNQTKENAKTEMATVREAYKTHKQAAMEKFKEAVTAAKKLHGEERAAAMRTATEEKNAALKAAKEARKAAKQQIELEK